MFIHRSNTCATWLLLFCGATTYAQTPPSLDQATAQLISDNYDAIHRCYRRVLAVDRNREGTTFVRGTLTKSAQLSQLGIERDELHAPALQQCLVAQISTWHWPKKIVRGAVGDEIVIPLSFQATPTQQVIDIADVPSAPDQRCNTVTVRQLLTEKNAGVQRATLNELQLTKGCTWADTGTRAHIWLIARGTGTLQHTPRNHLKKRSEPVTQLTAIYVPPHTKGLTITAARNSSLQILQWDLRVTPSPATDLIISTPNRSARRLLSDHQLQVDPLLYAKNLHHQQFYLGALLAKPGLHVPAHNHLAEDEIVFVLSGSGITELDGRTVSIHAGHAIFIPATQRHGFTAQKSLSVVHLYLPGGPEQKFFQ